MPLKYIRDRFRSRYRTYETKRSIIAAVSHQEISGFLIRLSEDLKEEMLSASLLRLSHKD